MTARALCPRFCIASYADVPRCFGEFGWSCPPGSLPAAISVVHGCLSRWPITSRGGSRSRRSATTLFRSRGRLVNAAVRHVKIDPSLRGSYHHGARSDETLPRQIKLFWSRSRRLKELHLHRYRHRLCSARGAVGIGAAAELGMDRAGGYRRFALAGVPTTPCPSTAVAAATTMPAQSRHTLGDVGCGSDPAIESREVSQPRSRRSSGNERSWCSFFDSR